MVSPVPGVAFAETVNGDVIVELFGGVLMVTVVVLGGGGVDATVMVMDLVVTAEELSVAVTESV